MVMDIAHDIVIIGGGVTGCSVLFELTCRGYRCQLLEKNDAIVSEASAGNSGMLHTGFDALDNSIEQDCIRRCQLRVFSLSEKLGVPVNKIGATMVAWNKEQVSRFPSVISKSANAGFHDLKQLSMSQLYQKECNLHSGAHGAIWIPGEAVTDPWLLPVLLANDAKNKGAEIVTNAKVETCNWNGNEWEIVSTLGISRARCAINCAGLYGDIVDCLAGKTQFSIKPRKGQYTVYNKTAKGLINSSIVPVPSKVGKGVIVFRSIYDNVVVGPTAQDCGSRLRAPVDNYVCQQLYGVADRTVPQLNSHKVIGHYTGVRPATQYKDYIISADKERNWITVGGIRSTGLSGCLGIAEFVHNLTENTVGVEPSYGSCFTVSSPCVTFTQSGSALIDGQEYSVRHPLTRFGKLQSLTKL